MARLAQWVMYGAPVYAIIGIALGIAGVPGWLVLLPIPLIFMPATAYLTLRK